MAAAALTYLIIINSHPILEELEMGVEMGVCLLAMTEEYQKTADIKRYICLLVLFVINCNCCITQVPMVALYLFCFHLVVHNIR